jgi:hypothetical protein
LEWQVAGEDVSRAVKPLAIERRFSTPRRTGRIVPFGNLSKVLVVAGLPGAGISVCRAAILAMRDIVGARQRVIFQ